MTVNLSFPTLPKRYGSWSAIVSPSPGSKTVWMQVFHKLTIQSTCRAKCFQEKVVYSGHQKANCLCLHALTTPSSFVFFLSWTKITYIYPWYIAQRLGGRGKNWNKWFKLNITSLRIPTGRRQTSWSFGPTIWTWGHCETNPASGQSGTRTRDCWIASLMHWSLGHATSSDDFAHFFIESQKPT